MDWNTAITWYVGLMLLTAAIVCLFASYRQLEFNDCRVGRRKALAWIVLAVVNAALLAGWIAPQP